MYRTVLFLLFVIVSSGLQAEWLKIKTNDNLTTYVDPATVSKAENNVRMWGIVDLKESRKEQEGKDFLSAKGLQEYDCEGAQTRKISLTLYSGNMGAGEVVHTYADEGKWKWTSVVHGSVTESMWKTACGKK